MRSARSFLGDIAGIREGEFERLLLMAAYLLLIITCYTTTKAARDSLFVIEIGPSQLPYLYVLSAVSMAAISAIYTKSVNRIGLYSVIRMTSFLAIAHLLIFWWLARYQTAVWFYVLYVWVSLFGAITASQAWLLATQVFDAREARRLFAWIAVGGILGGIAGGALAKFVAPWFGTEALLLVCAGLMLLTTILLRRIVHKAEQQKGENFRTQPNQSAEERIPIFAEIRKSRHLTLVLVLLVTGVIVEAFMDYEFKFISRQAFSSKNDLTAFFGTISSYGGLLALLVQLVITSRLLKRFGAASAILLLPSALLVAFVTVALRPVLWSASVLRLVDGALSYSVHRSGMELLYVPVPARQRNAVKAFIDMFVDRMGRATGGLLLLLLTVVLSLTVSSLSFVASGFLVVWLITALAVRRQYLQAFRLAVEKKTIEPEALQIQSVDSATIETLLVALSSSDDRQVLYALDLLGPTHLERWRDYRPTLIRHRAPAVRARSIALLAECKDASVSSLIGERLQDPHLEVRIEAIHYLCATSRQSSERLKEFLHHSDYRIVHSSIHYMSKYQVGDRNLIDEPLIEAAASATGEHGVIARTAAACALGLQWSNSAKAQQFLNILLQDSSPEVVLQAIRTSGEVRYEGAREVLVEKLAQARLRRETRVALLKFGESMIAHLLQRLEDGRTPLGLRIRIPKVLAYTLRQDVADVLISKIHRLDSAIDNPLMKALNIMRSKSPELRFDVELLEGLIRKEIEKHENFDGMLESLARTPGDAGLENGKNVAGVVSILTKAIRERREQTIEKTFRLLALIYAPADVYSAYFTFTGKPALRASAVEFLDNLLEPRFKDLVVPLLDDYKDEETGRSEESAEVSWEDALHGILECDDLWLRTIAQDLAGRLGVSEAA